MKWRRSRSETKHQRASAVPIEICFLTSGGCAAIGPKRVPKIAVREIFEESKNGEGLPLSRSRCAVSSYPFCGDSPQRPVKRSGAGDALCPAHLRCAPEGATLFALGPARTPIAACMIRGSAFRSTGPAGASDPGMNAISASIWGCAILSVATRWSLAINSTWAGWLWTPRRVSCLQLLRHGAARRRCLCRPRSGGVGGAPV